MKIGLSSRERAAIAAVMHRAPWLGGRAILLQRALYVSLNLGEFLGKEAGQLLRLSLVDRTIYEIPDDSAAVLAACLTIDGQSCDLALVNSGTLERLDPILAAATAPAPAPKPTDDDDKTPQRPAPAPPPVDAPPADPPAPAAAAPHVNGVAALGRLVRNGRGRRRGVAP